jgi:hypothetical protein
VSSIAMTIVAVLCAALTAVYASETNEWKCMSEAARQAWLANFVVLPSTTVGEAFQIIETESRRMDPSGMGVTIADIREQRGDQSRITVIRSNNVVSALLGCIDDTSRGDLAVSASVCFLQRTAVVGNRDVFVLPCTVILMCRDKKTAKPVDNVVLTPLSCNSFGTLPRRGLIDGQKVTIWTVQIMVPVVTGARANWVLVDKDEWRKVFRYRVSATGYSDEICEQPLFGDINDSNYVTVDLRQDDADASRTKQSEGNEAARDK